MHDVVIRGGTILDGTGRAGFTGAVAIDGEHVAAVGGKAGPARRDIDVDGHLVTPGWVVAGTPVFERGEHTGAKPGRLVHAGR